MPKPPDCQLKCSILLKSSFYPILFPEKTRFRRRLFHNCPSPPHGGHDPINKKRARYAAAAEPAATGRPGPPTRRGSRRIHRRGDAARTRKSGQRIDGSARRTRKRRAPFGRERRFYYIWCRYDTLSVGKPRRTASDSVLRLRPLRSPSYKKNNLRPCCSSHT